MGEEKGMRSIRLLLLVMALTCGVANCAGSGDDNDEARVVGTWAARRDYGCTGHSFTGVLHISADGTVTANDSNAGRWRGEGNGITLDFTESLGDILVGTLESGNAMSGTITGGGGRGGCWSAAKTSDTP